MTDPLPRALQAGLDFFLSPSMDGHLRDRAPGEAFDTQFGVTEMSYRDAVSKGVQVKPWDEWTVPEDSYPIYQHCYWDANRCGEMPPCVAMVAFVDGTLMGVRTVAKHLQVALGVSPDGIIGGHTLGALAERDARWAASELDTLDLAYLRTLANWETFHNGWTTREQKLLAAALALGDVS
jgi:lysozyme family protein